MASNEFFKVDCGVLYIFSLNFDLDLSTWFLGSNTLRRMQILRGPLVRVVARRSASVWRRHVEKYGVGSLLRLGRVGGPSWLSCCCGCVCGLWLSVRLLCYFCARVTNFLATISYEPIRL